MQMISRNNNTLKLVVTYIIHLLQQQEGRARDLFAKLDTSGDGSLSEMEFSQGLMQLGFTLAEDETKHLFQAIDDDASGDIEIREFVRLLRQPLDVVQVTTFELLDGLRRLEVVVNQEHANAVHQYLTEDHTGHNCVDVSGGGVRVLLLFQDILMVFLLLSTRRLLSLQQKRSPNCMN